MCDFLFGKYLKVMLLLINTIFHYTFQSLLPCLLPCFPICFCMAVHIAESGNKQGCIDLNV